MSDDPISGHDLIYLLGLGFQQPLREFLGRLEAAGWDDLRPVHAFTLRAISAAEVTSVELAARLGVTKQAAGQLIDYLEARGYVERQPHPLGGRRRHIALTTRARQHLSDAAAIMRDVEAEWTAALGAERMLELRASLAALVRAATPDGAVPPLRPAW